jgi:hypothetical protein
MSTATARLWRTQPKYEGLCSDGWYQTPDGRIHFRPNPDVDLAKAKLFVLLEADDLPLRPLITTVPIDGRLPTAEQVAGVAAAVLTAPPRVVAAFRQAGGQIQVVAGQCASIHPLFPRDKRIPAGMLAAGFHSRQPPLIVVAAAADPRTVLHELGHRVDGPLSGCRFSESITWQQVGGQVARLCGFTPYHSTKGESFAQFFAEWCKGAELPVEAARLVRRAVAAT